MVDKRLLPHRTSRIEQLPDDVLLLILSNLTLTDVVRTSTLSRRWTNLWCYTTCLDFDATTLLPLNRIDNHLKWYVAWVNKFIKARENMPGLPSVKELRIRCTLRNRKTRHIDRWISFAIANRVEMLRLELDGYKLRMGRYGPNYILSEKAWLKTPTGISSLGCLKSLFLSCVNVNQQFIEFVLSNCPLLEDLSLQSVGNYTHLKVSSMPPLRLKRLNIDESDGPVITKLCAPLLTSFSYKSIKNSFKTQKIDVPMLTDLTIGSRFESLSIMKWLEYFWSYLPQLEKLDLIMGLPWESELKKPTEELVKLKYLKMCFDGNTNHIADQILSFMSACPLLSTFAIEIYVVHDVVECPFSARRTQGREQQLEKDLSFNCLKVLELYGAKGETIDQEIVSCILSKSPNLEKLTVDTRIRCSDPMFLRFDQRVVEIVQAKAQVLCRRSHPDIKIKVIG